MPARVDFANQRGEFIRYPAECEKRSLEILFIEEIEYAVRVDHDAGGQLVPLAPWNHL